MNAEVEAILRKMVNGHVESWPHYLDFAQLAINSHINSRHGSTPFALMFGRVPNEFKDYSTSDVSKMDITEMIKRHWSHTMHNLVYPAIREKVEMGQQKAEEQFNDAHKLVNPFLPGSMVMLKDVTRDSKWHAAYEGTFEVVRQNQGGAYILCVTRVCDETNFTLHPK
jgi:phage portal protein BeeE